MPRNRKKNKAKAQQSAAAEAKAAEEARKATVDELASADTSSPEYMKGQGNKAFLAGQFDMAIEWFTRAINADPTNHKLYSNRSAAGVSAANVHAFREALKDATKCIELAPEWAKGYFRRGVALKSLFRYGEAKQAFQQALDLDPTDAATKRALTELAKYKVADFMPETGDDDDGEKDKFQLMEEWLRTPIGDSGREATVAEFPLLYMKRYSENNRGVHCVVDIPPEKRILTIPCRYLMTVEMGKESSIGQKMVKADVDVTAEKHCYLCVFSMVDRRNPDSYFQPYYNILPTSYPNMPIFWSEEELSWLEGSYLLKQVEDRLHNISEDYDEICRAAPEWVEFSMEEFKWARMMVASRNFGVNIDGTRTDALVPYADMLNHFRPRETRWTFSQKEYCFTITTIKHLKAGQQIYDSYGKKCNSRFLLNYGFAVEDNADPEGQNHNEVRLLYSLRPQEEDPFYSMRMGLLQDGRKSRGIRVGTWYDYKSTLEAFSFLRFAYAEGEELMVLPPLSYDLDLGKTPIKPISSDNEIKVIEHFSRLFKVQLKRYPRTREQDDADIRDGTYEFGTNHRNVIVVLRGEKEVCEYYANLPEVVVPILRMQWKEAKKVLNKMYKSASPALLKYLQSVVAPLLRRESSTRPAGAAAPAAAPAAETAETAESKKAGKKKKKGKH